MIKNAWLFAGIFSLMLTFIGVFQWKIRGHRWPAVAGVTFSGALMFVCVDSALGWTYATALILGVTLWCYAVTYMLCFLWSSPWRMRWFYVPGLAVAAWVLFGAISSTWMLSLTNYEDSVAGLVWLNSIGPFYGLLGWLWLVGILASSSDERQAALQSDNASMAYYAACIEAHRGPMQPMQWLEMTQRNPQFMQARWWRKTGMAFWPDMLEWEAKMGTMGMIWLFKERMLHPPIAVEDYSSSGAIWAPFNADSSLRLQSF